MKIKDNTNIKIILAVIISVIVSSGVTAFAAITVQANQIGYNTTTVADALDSMYNTMFSDNYSETEKVIGTWINGKPLYQKVIKRTSALSNNTNISLGVSDIEYAFIKYAWGVQGTTLTPINYGESSSWFAVVYITPTNINIQGSGNFFSYRAANGAIFVICYTKTTDPVPSN